MSMLKKNLGFTEISCASIELNDGKSAGFSGSLNNITISHA